MKNILIAGTVLTVAAIGGYKIIQPPDDSKPITYKLTWEHPWTNVIFSIISSTDMVNWIEIGQTTNKYFYVTNRYDKEFFNVGLVWDDSNSTNL